MNQNIVKNVEKKTVKNLTKICEKGRVNKFLNQIFFHLLCLVPDYIKNIF